MVIDILILCLVGVILTGAIVYIISQKKKGHKCIGCPNAKNCSGNCGPN